MEWDVLVELSTASLYVEASHSQFEIPFRTITILSVAVVRKPMGFLHAVHEIKTNHRENLVNHVHCYKTRNMLYFHITVLCWDMINKVTGP